MKRASWAIACLGLVLITCGTQEHKKDNARGVQELVEKLQDSDGFVRRDAAAALAEIGPMAKPAAPALIECVLNEPDILTREHAARALLKMGQPAKDAISALSQRLLKDPSPMNRENAAQTLAKMAPAANQAIPALIKSLSNDLESHVRHASAYALGQLGAEEAITPLIAAFRKDPWIRVTVADALGELGPTAAPAVPVLLEVIRTTEVPVHWGSSCQALQKIGAPSVPVLLEALDDTGSRLLQCVAASLEVLAQEGYLDAEAHRIAVPGLVRLLGHEAAKIRKNAVAALGAIGPAATAAEPELAKLGDTDPDDDVRQAARKALEALRQAP